MITLEVSGKTVSVQEITEEKKKSHIRIKSRPKKLSSTGKCLVFETQKGEFRLPLGQIRAEKQTNGPPTLYSSFWIAQRNGLFQKINSPSK